MRETAKLKEAKALRRTMTDAEWRLWYRLRAGRFLGLKFRRQCPIGPYIADFACMEKWLIVEVDGGQHALNQSYDAARDHFMRQEGFTILRFWNNEVLQNMDAVLEVIAANCKKCPHPSPLPLFPANAGAGEGGSHAGGEFEGGCGV